MHWLYHRKKQFYAMGPRSIFLRTPPPPPHTHFDLQVFLYSNGNYARSWHCVCFIFQQSSPNVQCTRPIHAWPFNGWQGGHRGSDPPPCRHQKGQSSRAQRSPVHRTLLPFSRLLLLLQSLHLVCIFNPLKTSPEYTRAVIYGKCVL